MRRSPEAKGFSLVELMVATVILTVIMGVVFGVISQVSQAWKRSSDQISSFQGARTAFELMTYSLSQATMNTYLDYDSPTSPQRYLRKSELKFLNTLPGEASIPGTLGTGQAVFFQAPLSYTQNNTAYGGMESLLNTCGFYIEFGEDTSKPAHVTVPGGTKYRYRLMQMLVPAEENTVYSSTGQQWILDHVSRVSVVAENVLALVVRPQDPGLLESEVPNNTYLYDTSAGATADPQPVTAQQLPPLAKITLVAIDESSAGRIFKGSTPPDVIVAALQDKFSDTSKYEEDLNGLTSALLAANIQYRVFEGTVPLRESNWTK